MCTYTVNRHVHGTLHVIVKVYSQLLTNAFTDMDVMCRAFLEFVMDPSSCSHRSIVKPSIKQIYVEPSYGTFWNPFWSQDPLQMCMGV